MGDRPGGDAADAADQRSAGPHRGAGRRAAQDRPRRRDRRAARGRGVRLRLGAARRLGVHHDARLPPRHLPGRDRHADARAAGQVQRQTRVRRDVLRVHRRGGARAPGRARPALARRGRRPGRPDRRRRRALPLEGRRAGPLHGAGPAGRARDDGTSPAAPPGPRTREGARPRVLGAVPAGARGRDARLGGAAHRQRRPHRRHAARVGDQPALRGRGVARRHHHAHLHRFGRAKLRRLRPPRRDHAAVGRRERLLRQGPLGWAPGRAPTGRVSVRRRGADHRRQRHPLRRHGWRGLHPGPGGGALLRAQFRRDRRRRRAWGTTGAST